jgi:arylsulfatase A-like enzyme
VAARSIDLLRRRDRTRPFFLFMSFHRPHPPLDPPAVYWDMYRDREVPPVPVGAWASGNDVTMDGVSAFRGRLPGAVLARSRRAYWAQIAHIDNQIGRLINALRRELQPGPTWFVFSSDHGEMLGDHHLFRKCHAYEGSARIPLVICPPGAEFSETAGSPVGDFLRTAPVTLTDLYPTILEMAGLPVPARTEGRSLLPLLKGDRPVAGREYVHGEHSGLFLPEMDMQYLTDGRWKYIWFPATGREQLFELSSDPDELRDLAADPTCREQLELWRSRLATQLAPRGEDGLSEGGKLIPGRRLPTVRPALLAEG